MAQSLKMESTEPSDMQISRIRLRHSRLHGAFQADDAAIRSVTGAFFPSFGTVDEGKIEEHDRKPGGKRAMSNLIKAGLVALVLCLAAPVAAGPFEDGADAAERGDFATALQLWQLLTNQGDPRAQQSLGNMYANGQGVPQDDAEAVKWFRKAADQGDPYGPTLH